MRILDTSALMDDPLVAIPQHEHESILIPSLVVTELDRHKENPMLSGKARPAIRQLLKLVGDDRVKYVRDGHELGEADDQIIHLAQRYAGLATVITNDLALQLRCNIESCAFDGCRQVLPDVIEVSIYGDVVDELHNAGRVELGDKSDPNTCIKLVDMTNKGHTALGVIDHTGHTLVGINKKTDMWGVKPSGMEQQFYAHFLMDPAVRLISVAGKAGSGKTMLAIAGALDAAFGKKQHRNIHVTRPLVVVGEKVGFLKGDLDEKLDPYFGAVDAIFDRLLGSHGEHLMERVVRLPLTYVRGLTIENSVWVIDEAQNFSDQELRTLLTRVGKKTKVIVTGDLSQSDTRNSGSGLLKIVRAFQGEPFYAHVSLKKVQRDIICEIATSKM